MGNIGPGEILLVAALGLLIFGPKKLPEISRSLGRALREFRRATGELTEELKAGLDDPQPLPSETRADKELRPGPRS